MTTIRQKTVGGMNGVSWLAVGSLLLSTAACGAEDSVDASEEPLGTSEEALSAGQLTRGDYLFPGQELHSSNCSFRLRMSTSGNLFLQRMNFDLTYGGAYWQKPDGGSPDGAFAHLNSSGTFGIYRHTNGTALWSVGGNVTRVRLQSDGNLIGFEGSTVKWDTRTVLTPHRTCWDVAGIIGKTSDVTEVLSNTDLNGLDMAPSPILGTTWQGCGVECGSRPACKAFTWVPPTLGGGAAQCWIKSAIPGAIVNNGMISGRKKYVTVGGLPI